MRLDYQPGVSFVLNSIVTDQSVFRNTPTESTCRSYTIPQMYGYGLEFSRLKSLQRAVGEYFERSSLFQKAHTISSDTLLGYDIVSDQTVSLPLNRILLGDPQVILHTEYRPLDLYQDTTGASSHRTSFDAINAAFLEFFERQSFIYSWLTCSPGRVLAFDQMPNHTSKFYKQLRTYFDDIYVIDISLDERISVIISIGLSELYMSVGLGCNWDENIAVWHSLRELYQGINRFITKSSTGQTRNISPSPDASNSGSYLFSFYSNYTPQTLKSSFNYLISESHRTKAHHKIAITDGNLHQLMKDIANRLNIDLILCFVPSILQDNRVKTVRLLSNGGYPHLRTDILNPMDHSISFHKANNGFPNLHKPIPFA